MKLEIPESLDSRVREYFRDRRDRQVVAAALLLIALSLLWNWIARPPDPIPRDQVWAYVSERAPEYGLEPGFVFAIVHAESTFDANASNRGARGLMQLRRPAWETITDRPFRHAWRWRANLDQGMAYLEYLRDFLEERTTFSYPRLAAAYRHGPYALENADFDVSRFPEAHNDVYRAIFSGNPSPIASPES